MFTVSCRPTPPARHTRPATPRLLTLLALLLAAISLSARPAAAQTTLIKFDDVPSGTVINTQYQSQGVTLSVTLDPYGRTSTGASVYARSASDAYSAPNVVTLVAPASSIFTFFDASSGAIKAAFASPASSVSIQAEAVFPAEYLGPGPAGPFIEAFDASGNDLGETNYNFAGPTWQTLTISSPQNNIAYVLFSAQYNKNTYEIWGDFDNLEFTTPPAPPQPRYVPSQYPTIQAAISAANPGDTVTVAPGTYTGTGNVNLDFGGKAIAVTGHTASDTIINCQGVLHARGVYFHTGEGAGSVFENFTVENGNEVDGISTGGGIYVLSGSPTIQGCVFTGNKAQYGGGLGVSTGSSPHVTGCTFSGDSAASTGGGAFVYSNSNPVFVNDVFEANTASSASGGNGGGMEVYAASNPVVTECTFTQNNAGASGGGIHLGQSSHATVTDTILWYDTLNNMLAKPTSEVGVDGGSTVTASSNVDQGGYLGSGNLNADPQFVNGIVPYDLHLRDTSPAIGIGTTGAPDYLPYDINSITRTNPPTLGAFDGPTPPVLLYALGYQNTMFQITDDPSQYAYLTMNGWVGGPTGQVYAHATDVTGLTPLYQLLENGSGDHFYTTDSNQRASLLASGAWQNLGVCCYVYSSQVSGTIPLLKALNTATNQHQFTGNMAQYNALPMPPWSLRGPAAYILPPPAPPVTLFALGYQNSMFLITDDASQAASLESTGWAGGPTGQVYANQFDAPSLSPLYRLLETASNDHFYTTDPAQRASLIASGAWQDRGVSCYVYATPVSGTVPLYKALNTTTNQHQFTGNMAQYNALPAPPWSLRGPAAYILP